MAAARWWRLVSRAPGRPLHSAAPAAAVGAPDAAGAEGAPPVARYPPIVASMTAHSKAARQRRVERWQARVHAARTADEKMGILTKMQFKKYVVPPQTFALHADRWYQGFTKTVFLSGLPPAAQPGAPPPPPPPAAEPGSPPPAAAQPGAPPPLPALAALRAAAADCLLQEHFYLRRRGRAPLYRQVEAVASPFLDQLVAALVGLLGAHNPALATAALDCKRPVHFYWWRGEEIIAHGHRKGRVDAVRYQINDKPHNQIRISKQLPEFVPLDYSVPIEIPVMNCKPDKLPLFKRQYENTIFTGFWSEADVTRPFVSQAVITDGKYFSFFCYQLNTLALTAQADQNNSRKNICWGTQSKPLYETIEDNDVKGFNDDVLLQIVHFLLNRPKEDKQPLLEK
ncbi:39S ribosomal protein S30, mitochondrial isoform X3 [Pipistrellus kuhlii]|uniref:39S ribosomal protein S30, mitochondrial isoform X3 n=1 Tax=Pipistrellus kuhlii TaxID=59472 RepID=UPI00174F76DF|nr:39S ribosomal protein S30, mitochondrial isoform X3 [Pipistrellus kuhlii]